MTPFEVAAYLSTPAVIDRPVMLDALLQAGVGAEIGRAHPSGYADPDEVYAAPLPLLRIEWADVWWYACSQVAPDLAQRQDHVNRTPLIEEYAKLTSSKSVNVASGPDKRTRTPFYYRPRQLIMLWDGIGDARRVAQLLQGVHSIGKLRAHGWGWVRRWEVRTLPGDLDEHVAQYRHPATRHVPALDRLAADGATRRRVPLTPPYWDRSRAVPCWQVLQ